MRSAALLSVLAFCVVCFSPFFPLDSAVADAPVTFDTVGADGDHLDGTFWGDWIPGGGGPTPYVCNDVPGTGGMAALLGSSVLGIGTDWPVWASGSEVQVDTTLYVDPMFGRRRVSTPGTTAVKFVFRIVVFDTVDPNGNHVDGTFWGDWVPYNGGTRPTPCACPTVPGTGGMAAWLGDCALGLGTDWPVTANPSEVQVDTTLYVDPMFGRRRVSTPGTTAVKFVFRTVVFDTVDPDGNHMDGTFWGDWVWYNGSTRPTPCVCTNVPGTGGMAAWLGDCALGLGTDWPVTANPSEVQVDTTLYVDPMFGRRRVSTPGTTAVKFVFRTVVLDTVDPDGNHMDGTFWGDWVWYNGSTRPTPCVCTNVPDTGGMAAWLGSGFLGTDWPVSADSSEVQVDTTLYVDPMFGRRRVSTPGTTAVKFVFRTVVFDTVDPNGNHVDGTFCGDWVWYNDNRRPTPCVCTNAPSTGVIAAWSGVNFLEYAAIVWANAGDVQVDTTLFVDPRLGRRREATPGTTAVKFVVGELGSDVEGPSTAFDLSGQMGDNNWFVGDVTVTITSTDGPDVGFSGVASIHYVLDGGAEQVVAVNPPAKTATTSFVVAAEGLHTVEAWAIDAAENVGAHATVQPPVDSVPPVTSATPDGDRVTLDAEDSGSGIEYIVYTLDGGEQHRCQPGTVVPVPEGNHTLIVWSVDNAGNIGNRVVVVFRIDKTAPVLHLPAPIIAEQAGPAGTVVTFAVTATDSLDPNPKVTCVPASGSVFAHGVTTVNCAATDAAGNQSTGSFTVTVHDHIPPSMTLTVLQANLWPPNHKLALVAEVTNVKDICDPSPIVTINVSCNETTDPSNWKVVRNGNVWEIWVASERLGNGSGREYYIDAVATDASGNSATKTATITVAHDQGKK